MTGDEINAMFADVGPLDDRIAGVARTDENGWAVTIAETNIELEFAEGGNRLVATAMIAMPPAGNQAIIMRALLAFSTLWRDTGFVHAAWPGAEQPALLIANVATAELTAKRLAGVLAGLAEKVALWREMFFSPIGADEAPSFDPMAFSHSLIRL